MRENEMRRTLLKEEAQAMKRHHLIFKGIALVVGVVLTGCASYTPTLVRLDPSGPNVGKAVQGDLTLYVEEYATPSKSEIAFDTDMAEEGVLPLLIQVANAGEEAFEVRGEDILVRGDDVLKTLTPAEAADKASRGAVGKAIGWSLIVPIIAIPVAATASALHTSGVNKKIVADFTAKAFQGGVVEPNNNHTGFLYLELPEGVEGTSGLSLELTAKNVATGEIMNLTAPVPAASFTPKKKASAPSESPSPTEPAFGEEDPTSAPFRINP
jgi:hypothetical protein